MKRILGAKAFLENPIRPYTFAVYFGREAEFEKERIRKVRFINMRISTGDAVFALKLYNGLVKLKGKVHKFGEAEFILKDFGTEKEKDWSGGYFKTLSPVIVERFGAGQDRPELRYATPADADFEKVLLDNILLRFRSIEGYEPQVKVFHFVFDYYKEEMIKHYGGYLRAFLGRFRIKTDNGDILRFVYQYGLGLRTGQGFGYLEVV